jgi:hypothetical protein
MSQQLVCMLVKQQQKTYNNSDYCVGVLIEESLLHTLNQLRLKEIIIMLSIWCRKATQHK